jgi:hypothetical protein
MRLTRWDQTLPQSDANALLLSLSSLHCNEISDLQVRDLISSLIERQDLLGLCSYPLDYSKLQLTDARHIRQIKAFFEKRKDLDLGIDKRRVAVESFMDAERLCRQTNHIFRKYAEGEFSFLPRVESVLYRAQCKIADILGDLPSLDEMHLRFGPGATTQVKKKQASPRRKLSQKFACSEDLLPILGEVLSEFPAWSNMNLDPDRSTLVPVELHASRIDFVRKTYKTDRTIAVEPMLNQMVQLGIGEIMADRLRREGVNIRDQTLNQRLAREGSLTGALATLDLSSASDTLSKGLVESLLPYDWWEFLSKCRSARGESLDTGPVFFEKFSSMGNGFTFPLETLVFYALAKACSRHDEIVSVYGDDIIVNVRVVPLLREVLTACGFLLNSSKSFWEGPFRESCGTDYYRGIDIRPCYVKGVPSAASLFTLHNHYARCWLNADAYLSRILEVLDSSIRIYGPDGFGDGHLLGDHRLEPHAREKGWSGYTFETFTYKAKKSFYKLGADYVYPSYSIYLTEDARMGLPLSPSMLGLSRGHTFPRPERPLVSYKGGFLEDTIPGVSGYKRIKIYTLG